MRTTFASSKKKFRTTLLALLLALLSLPTSLWADDQAYARLSSDGTTLTFRYDGNMQDGDYDINAYFTNDYEDEVPIWCQSGKVENITTVIFDASFAGARPTTCSGWFYEMENLTKIEGLKNLNTKEVTDMSDMFLVCTNLTSLDLSSFNTEKVTNMDRMFMQCGGLTDIDLSSFNTKNVTEMAAMFNGCSSVTSLDLSSFSTQNVINMFYMFYGCSSLASIFIGDNFVVSDDCEGEDMFLDCESLPNYDERKTGKEMANADNGYLLKREKGATTWVGYDEATKTLSFHYDAQRESASGDTYDLPTSTTDSPAWLAHNADVERVAIDIAFKCLYPTSCHSWFDGMPKLTSVDGLACLNTSKATDMSRMFAGCSSLTQIDLTSFNTVNVTDMSSMFADCSSLAAIYVGDDFTVADGCQGDDMFVGCCALPNYNATKTGKDMATLDGYFTKKAIMWVEYQDGSKTMTFHYDNKMDNTTATYKYKVDPLLEPEWEETCASRVEKVVIDPAFANARPTRCDSWFGHMYKLTGIEGMEYLNTSETTQMAAMFWRCEQLAEIDLSHLNTSKVTSMNGMFYRCKAVNELDLSKFDTHNVANMRIMFEDCSSLTELGLSTFNTDNVTNMEGMFMGCSNLTKLDILNFNTSKVTNMYDLFCGCASLESLDLKNFDTRNVTNMSCMFDGCSSLTELDLSNFNTENVANGRSMFSGMSSLTKLGVSSFNTSKITDMQEMFSNCPKLTELDLYSFDTSASKEFSYMLSGNTSLSKIYVSDKFIIDGGYEMFKGCSSLPGYDASKIDGSMANYTTGYLLKKVGTNGDEILGAKGSTLTIDDLQLSDGKPFVLNERCKATSASYTRSMTSTWGTLCLPYAIDATAESGNCKFYELQSVGENVIWLNELEDATIAAGTPVLVKKNDGQTSITFTATDADLVTAPVTAEGGDRLVGTFSGVVLKDASDSYFIAKDKFYRVSDYSTGNGVKVNPFRAYLQTTSISCASQLRLDGDTNGIDAATIAATLNDSATECYDINGRRTTGVQKGLNIVRLGNGKTMKVFVK